MSRVTPIFRTLGILRTLLFTLTILLIVMMPFADTRLSPHGWGLIRAVILPAAGPIVFMVLMLDLMMCQIWKGEFTGDARQRFVFISKWNLVLGLLLLVVWLPVFMRSNVF